MEENSTTMNATPALPRVLFADKNTKVEILLE